MTSDRVNQKETIEQSVQRGRPDATIRRDDRRKHFRNNLAAELLKAYSKILPWLVRM